MLIIDGDRRVHWANQAQHHCWWMAFSQVMNRCLDDLVTLHLPDGPSIQQDHRHPSQPLPLRKVRNAWTCRLPQDPDVSPAGALGQLPSCTPRTIC